MNFQKITKRFWDSTNSEAIELSERDVFSLACLMVNLGHKKRPACREVYYAYQWLMADDNHIVMVLKDILAEGFVLDDVLADYIWYRDFQTTMTELKNAD